MPTQEQIVQKLNEVIEVLNDLDLPPTPIETLEEEDSPGDRVEALKRVKDKLMGKPVDAVKDLMKKKLRKK